MKLRDDRPHAIGLIGPTASGKTALSMEIARSYDVEIISIDSALVYRDMDIGTAKPDPLFREVVPHHLIDIISPLESYSAAQCREDVGDLMKDIIDRNKLPLLVGGTMLYFQALISGLNALPPADSGVRAQLDHDAEKFGWPALHQRLQVIDPITAARLSPNDSQRIQRALEVFQLTGHTMSSLLESPQENDLPCQLSLIALTVEDRSVLHHRIHQRFDEMIEQGLIEEIIELKEKYPHLTLNYPSMRCVGYRQVWEYLEHKTTIEALREKGRAATRQLCKRQLTWLRKLPTNIQIDAFDPDIVNKINHYVSTLLN